jgi:uncharacterized protein YbjT (DUF2867 family)
VRVLTRSLNDRIDALAALGAEVAIGDLHDRRTLLPALAGVELVYFTYPVDEGVVRAAARRTIQPPCVSRSAQFGPW